jgi:hypothetical protein
MTDEAKSPLRRRMIGDMTMRKITPKTQQGYNRTVKDSNDETRAIGDAVIILTNSLKQSRLDSVEVFDVLKNWFALCRAKLVVRHIT